MTRRVLLASFLGAPLVLMAPHTWGSSKLYKIQVCMKNSETPRTWLTLADELIDDCVRRLRRREGRPLLSREHGLEYRHPNWYVSQTVRI